ncbi:MAG: choice-of-anchor tandem repeat GloVer-containing protein, partial [Candidatus Sulfotelmatobacter sp.]
FTGGADGGFPFSTLLRAPNGDLYGTTVFGGVYNQGTVFKISASGVETVLHSFSGMPDGAQPEGALIFDGKGNLVGTTTTGGASNNGAVFRLTPAGQEIVLYSFQGGTDGSVPGAGVNIDGHGNLYGTTFLGGSSAVGTVFVLTSSGRERVLHSFKGGTDGASPASALVRDSKGILYGTTNAGGASDLGTVFRVVP